MPREVCRESLYQSYFQVLNQIMLSLNKSLSINR